MLSPNPKYIKENSFEENPSRANRQFNYNETSVE
jgi:hypothetical protein